jgi:hypothetical protein
MLNLDTREKVEEKNDERRLIDSRKFLGVLKCLLSIWVKGLKGGARTLDFPRLEW